MHKLEIKKLVKDPFDGNFADLSFFFIDSYHKIIIEWCYREMVMSNYDNADNSYYNPDYNRDTLHSKDIERYNNTEILSDITTYSYR